MCRLAFYTGPPQPLSALVYTPPHGLHEQAYRPQEQQHGHVNVDGTGIAWWREGEAEPLRYVTGAPPWSDPNLPTLAPRLTGHTVLAAVRGATPGIGFGTDAVAPFVRSGVAFVHNGWIGGFREGVGPELARRLPDDLAGSVTMYTDSVLLFLTILKHRAERRDLTGSVRAGLAEAAALCTALGQVATLNVVVSDGVETVATRTSVGLDTNSLYLCTDAPGWPGGVLLASEPLDDGPWKPVDADTSVRVLDGRAAVSPFDPEREP